MKVLTLVAMVAFLSLVGCAKKQVKPDSTDISANSIQDKDMNFDATGSDSGNIPGLYTIHFDYDKSNLAPSEKELLVNDARWLKTNSAKSIQIEGHCDRHGSIEYNLALGQRRADTVKKYLVNLGVKADRIMTVSYGKEKMLDDSETDAADKKNRRANLKPVDSPKINHMSSL